MITRLGLQVIVAVALWAIGLANAGVGKQWSRCQNDHIDPKLRIDACTALLAQDYAPTEVRAVFFSNRASAYGDLGEIDQAIADYDVALKLAPSLVEALNGRCWVRAQAGRDIELALKDCNEALNIAPSNADALDSRGLVHLRLKRWKQAVADYSAELEEKPNEPTALYGRGTAILALGGKKAGQTDLAQAISLDAKVASQFAAMGIKP